jgi:hypothetical protein
MTHHHHHGHGPTQHPHDARAQAYPSLLRLSVAERLAGTAVLVAALWAAIFWAMS